jgi:hypothetical protein
VSSGYLLSPLASVPAPPSPSSLSPSIARLLPKSKANRRLMLAICADEEGEEAGKRSQQGEVGAGAGTEEMGPCKGTARSGNRSEMARTQREIEKASEDGTTQSAGRKCYNFCVGSIGPIAVDSELVVWSRCSGRRARRKLLRYETCSYGIWSSRTQSKAVQGARRSSRGGEGHRGGLCLRSQRRCSEQMLECRRCGRS